MAAQRRQSYQPMLRTALIYATLSCLAGTVPAQNYERYAPPQMIRPNETALPDLPTESLDEVGGDDRVLVNSLDAVVIVDAAEKVTKSNAFDSLEGIHYNFAATDSLVYRPDFQQLIQQRLGGPITLRRLNEMAREIILLYRRCKQPIVDVQIPEQRITGGTVHIVVVESRIGTVWVQPGCYFDCDEAKRWIQCTWSGDRIYETNLENDLLWLNQNPFRRVSVDFQKGQHPGTTDVLFQTKDVKPIRGYLGIDDTGVRTLNYGRAFGGFTYGNLFGRGGILGYQFTTDEDFRLLRAHAVSYTQPINRNWSVQSYGSWAGVRPELGLGLNQDGESWQVGTGLVRHLQRTRYRSQNVTLAIDFKSTDNNLEFAGTTIADSSADLLQLRFGYDHLWRSCQPDTYLLLQADAFVGPGGGLTNLHSAAAFQTIRADTSPDYTYGRLLLELSRPLGSTAQLLGRFRGQVASERLLFSETLGLGGFDTVRGFDQREFNADHGWIMNLEVGPKTKRWGCECQRRVLRTYGFVDAANGYLANPLAGEDASTFALSTGIGARFQIGDRFIARFDYGVGVEDLTSTGRDSRAHFGISWLPGPRP